MNNSNTSIFIEKSNEIHGYKYDYSKSVYIKNNLPVKIICPVHGEFEITPNSHLSQKSGCRKCGIERLKKSQSFTKDEFITIFKKKYNINYDYSETVYVNIDTKIKVKCLKHGYFNVLPSSLLSGAICKQCRQENKQSSFLQKAFSIHGDTYIYSATTFVAERKKLKLDCKKHGTFLITPEKHIKRKQGCPKCRFSIGEKTIENILKNKNINFTTQQRFKDCKNPLTNYQLPFDFYLPNEHICIEYDGDQHFRPYKRFGGQEQLEKIQFRDKIKNEYCLNNKISLLRINYTQNIELTLMSYLFSGSTISNINQKTKEFI